ncbi:DUF4837 family protein [candidate division WOR-3 bacterium]|nr:DUF4837 family protein [candidate division WOR-3 bacterium]
MRKTVIIILAFLLLILSSFGCTYKPDAVGMAREVVIFTDHKELVEDELSFALKNTIYTPQPGDEFFLRYKKINELEANLIRHSLLFVGLEQDSIINFMKGMYPELNSHDSFSLYAIRDLWAKGQSVIVFVARDSQYMVEGLGSVRANLRKEFKIKLLERMEGVTYAEGVDRKLSTEIEKYGFKLRIPDGWILDERYADDNFVWVHNFYPNRLVFIYWEETERENLSREEILALRDSLTTKFYEGDSLYLPLTIAGPYYFRGYEAIRIDGVWQNDSLEVNGRKITGGGPMISFAFNAKGRFWMIDGMLFLPETPRKKIFWLNQLEVILANFQPL